MIKRTSTRTSKAAVAAPEPAPTPEPKSQGSKSPTLMRVMPFIVALVLLVGGAGYFVHASGKTKTGSTLAGDTSIQVREGVDAKEIETVIDRVRVLVASNEEVLPAVATIEDISVLRGQNPVLYRDAQNGDRVLLWQDLLVVYSTTRDRVLAAMPIVVETPQQEQAQNVPVPEKATIEVRNGTQTPGTARVLSDQLKAMGFTMLAPTDAQTKTYTKTKILVSSGKSFPETIKRLLEATGGEVVDSLPTEGTTRADILVIVGK